MDLGAVGACCFGWPSVHCQLVNRTDTCHVNTPVSSILPCCFPELAEKENGCQSPMGGGRRTGGC